MKYVPSFTGRAVLLTARLSFFERNSCGSSSRINTGILFQTGWSASGARYITAALANTTQSQANKHAQRARHLDSVSSACDIDRGSRVRAVWACPSGSANGRVRRPDDRVIPLLPGISDLSWHMGKSLLPVRYLYGLSTTASPRKPPGATEAIALGVRATSSCPPKQSCACRESSAC